MIIELFGFGASLNSLHTLEWREKSHIYECTNTIPPPMLPAGPLERGNNHVTRSPDTTLLQHHHRRLRLWSEPNRL